jgi:EAL domain-containing protein (putative c-di-GMP-specific phosphodiesterase class I)
MTASMFMPVAERMGLATEIDQLAIGKLLNHMQTGSNQDVLYTINLSSCSLHNPVFIQWLCSTLQAAPACAARLLIEFPEFAAQINTQDTRNLVERLGSLGCQCGLDHFGRGFYSFGYLRNMKLYYLEIDSSYTRHIDREEDQQFLLRALTDTAHSVDIAVIAQSVETPEERTRLESMHLDGIQGFLTGKPRPITADQQNSRLTPRSGCG